MQRGQGSTTQDEHMLLSTSSSSSLSSGLAMIGNVDAPRLEITPRMRSMLDYCKFAGAPRMLVLETNYFFERSWLRAAESLGWQAATVPSAMVGDLTREDVRKFFETLVEFKPDFVLASNFAGMDAEGLFGRFLEDARIPYVSWFTDTPRMILYDRKVHCSHYSVAATWERAYTGHFQRLGFEHTFYMPLATDLSLFNGRPSESCARPLAFVGNSMIEFANEAWEKLEERPRVVRAILDAFSEGRVTPDRFAEGIDAMISADLLRDCTSSELRTIELCIVYEATRRQRAELAVRLEPYGLQIRGDLHWRHVASNADGPVGYFDDLAPFYRDTLINLNSTSLQMKSAVNQRVFDCPAAGGFLITDAQQDLEEHFDPATELVTYSSLDELEDRVAYYLRNPQSRIPIVRQAQRRIAAHHTHAHRLQSLESYLRERYA